MYVADLLRRIAQGTTNVIGSTNNPTQSSAARIPQHIKDIIVKKPQGPIQNDKEELPQHIKDIIVKKPQGPTVEMMPSPLETATPADSGSTLFTGSASEGGIFTWRHSKSDK